MIDTPFSGILRLMHARVCRWPFGVSVLVGLFSCSGPDADGTQTGTSGGAGGGGFGAMPSAATGGVSVAASGGSWVTGGTSSSGGTSTSGGTNAGGSGSGGDLLDAGGSASTGGDTAQGSGGQLAGCGSIEPLPVAPALDCGESAIVLRDVGRPENRVNYIILGDGYTAQQLDSLYVEHVENMLEHELGMFGEMGQPYGRYKNFINICALRVESQDGCVDDRDTGLECDTAFNGYGDDASRLGIVDERLVYAKIGELLPQTMDADWIAVTIMAGADNWWNSGGAIMVWNGGYEPRGQSASVALHEGGHAFHGLADEYAGDSQMCAMAAEKNVSTGDDGAKWAEWLGFDHSPGTGLHGSYEGARYCSRGVYRPTENSEMNQLPDYFNMPSMQKMVHDIHEVVDPIDAHTENSDVLTNPVALQVRVIDAEVIRLRWFVDEVEQPGETGECFSMADVAPGRHSIEVVAEDETPWVRDDRSDLSQTVAWTVSIEP